ncbi:MAG: histidine kinase [Woeseiaceae bacterium]|nr:histidine kinase [Woeseiaceae bacterium]
MTEAVADEKTVKDRWRYFFLIYIAFYFPEWLWRPPGTVDYVAIAIALAVFVPIFLSAHEKHLPKYTLHIAAYEFIAIALSPFSGLHGVFHIYACAQAGYQRPKSSATKIIIGLTLFYIAFNIVTGASTQDLFNAMFALVFGLITGFGCMSHADTLERERNLNRARVLERQRATLAERERIAHDLHDLLGHTLTMIAVKSELASKLMDKDLDRAKREVDEVAGSARDGLKEIRAAVYDMTVTTVEAEIELARQALDAAGISLTVDDDLPPLSPPLGKALGLTIREAVTNIVRHSKADSARIQLRPGGDELTLTISDNGVGNAGGSGSGAGLDGVRKRITALGGDMQLTSRDGTELSVSLPFADELPAGSEA